MTDKKKKSAKKANPVGRPPMYKTAEAMQKKIDKYFNGGAKTRTLFLKDGATVEVPVLTITGLVLYLGFCDRHSFYEYEDKPIFTHTIKKARSFIEQEYEILLQKGLGAGAIFALKNFGWIDRTEVEQTVTRKAEIDLDVPVENKVKIIVSAISEGN